MGLPYRLIPSKLLITTIIMGKPLVTLLLLLLLTEIVRINPVLLEGPKFILLIITIILMGLLIMTPRSRLTMKMGNRLGSLAVPTLQLLEHIHVTVLMFMWKRQLQPSKLPLLGPIL